MHLQFFHETFFRRRVEDSADLDEVVHYVQLWLSNQEHPQHPEELATWRGEHRNLVIEGCMCVKVKAVKIIKGRADECPQPLLTHPLISVRRPRRRSS